LNANGVSARDTWEKLVREVAYDNDIPLEKMPKLPPAALLEVYAAITAMQKMGFFSEAADDVGGDIELASAGERQDMLDRFERAGEHWRALDKALDYVFEGSPYEG
jgi:hypothetical protein